MRLKWLCLFLTLAIYCYIGELLAQSPVLTQDEQRVKIISIIENPDQYEGKLVSIKGKFAGWMHIEEMNEIDMSVCNKGPCLTRSDIQIYDDTACIYVAGADILDPESKEISLEPGKKQDAGKDIVVKGKVAIAEDGRPYIKR